MSEYITPKDEGFLGSMKSNDLSLLCSMSAEYIHSLSDLDGNPLNLSLVKDIIDGKPVKASPANLRDVVNIKRCLDMIAGRKKKVSSRFISELHGALFDGIPGSHAGQYRDHDVEIYGSEFMPPTWEVLDIEMDRLIDWLLEDSDLHPFEKACILHLRLASIHPFFDGNGRIASLVMNQHLLLNKLPLLIIPPREKAKYFEILEYCQMEKTESPFIDWMCARYIKRR